MPILIFILSVIIPTSYSAPIKGSYMDLNDPEIAGIKDAMCMISGKDAFGHEGYASATLISETELLTA
ncbi:MAG: hypothetical protein V1647_07110 [Pseudomonadota bacterium]